MTPSLGDAAYQLNLPIEGRGGATTSSGWTICSPRTAGARATRKFAEAVIHSSQKATVTRSCLE